MTPNATSLAKKMLFSFVMLVLFFAAVELVLRVVGFSYTPREMVLWKPTVAGFAGTHEFYIETKFAPPGYLWISQPNSPYTDSFGFRKPELSFRKPAGKIRVAYLGGSTTQGGYRPYPERATRLLNEALGLDVYEALNAACSSYSTHHSRMVLDRWVLDREPDRVFIYHGWNDSVLAQDGFRDHDKDRLSIAASERLQDTRTALLSRFRVMHLIGSAVDASRGTWPEARVPPERFKENLEAMIEQCRARNIPVSLFVRPDWRTEPPAPLGEELPPFYRERLGNLADVDLQKAINDLYAPIIHELAAGDEAVTAFDARAVINQLEQNRINGDFGPFLQIYQPDGSHLTSFGEELLAIEVARFIAPEHAEALDRYLNSATYYASRAREFIDEVTPHAADYFARKALQHDPDMQPVLQPLLDEAASLFDFAEWFERGRWGGIEQDFDRKIEYLQRCLKVRPNDAGVLIQIYRVCIYSQRMDRLAEAMRGFKPANLSEQYQVLRFEMESHLHAQRWPQAYQAAGYILQINPNDDLAQQVVQQLSAPRP